MDRRYLPTFVPKVLRTMEGAGDNPYRPRFVGGRSGMSFGLMQNDAAANPDAARTLQNVLNDTKSASGLSDADIAVAMRIATTPGATKEQLDAAIPGGSSKVEDALRAGSAAVDARDSAQEQAVLGYVNKALDAGGAGNEVDPWLVTDYASWGNRTGGLDETSKYAREHGVTTRQAYDQGYLSLQPEFTKRPFAKLSARVDDATRGALMDIVPELRAPEVNLFNSQQARNDVYDTVSAALRGGVAHAGERDPEVRLWNSETDSMAPVPGNLLNSDALPDNLLNMSDYEMRKWGLR